MKVNYPFLSLFCLLTLVVGTQAQQTTQKQPNFIVIVADDMGFSDMGMFGGEISTPNLDELANQGVRYTNFYVAPTCSPTRSMLLSGIDCHLVGLGNMIERTAPNQEGLVGYEGVLNHRAATLPEILRDNGYHTYMAGKWHQGKDPDHIPRARGFERDFTMLDAAGSHFDQKALNRENVTIQFTSDGQYTKQLPGGHYSTKTYTDKIIEFIESNRSDNKPFFAYVAHQAPHDPLQVPDSWLRKYKGKYDNGWDEIRKQRLARMKELGLISDSAELAPRLWYVPSWDAMTGVAQVTLARKMELYASMVEYLDMEIGRLVAYLKETGELDNTYIIFFSDNGPESRDAMDLKGKKASMDASYLARTFDTDYPSWGRKGSYVAYGVPWAQVCATPFWLFKGTINEGGIRSPLIVIEPKHTNAGSINTKAIMHVKDIAPTLLELAGIEQPKTFEGRAAIPMQGASWVSTINGTANSPRTDEDWIGFEWWGAKMVRQGDWKLVWMPKPTGIDNWELINLLLDPAEHNNLAALYPERVQAMAALWDKYAAENNVVIGNRTVFDGMEEKLPPRPPVDDSWPPDHEPNYGEKHDAGDDK